MLKIILTLTVIGAIFAGILLFLFNAKPDLPDQLRQLGYEVGVKEITFRGYEAQKISAEKSGTKVLLQAVNNVEANKFNEILIELTAPIGGATEDITIFDPYTGEEVSLSVPENLKPLQREITINGQSVEYYLVNANIIFSLRIYSEIEVRYKGLFTTYFCEKDATAYKLEIYYPIEEEFDEEKATTLLSSLFCR